MELTIEHARRVLEVVDHGLVLGVGAPIPGQMCVEAAVCFALGLPHGDDPSCVGRAVRAFKIQLNDSRWSSDKARAKGMRRVAIAQLGSDQIDQQKFRTEVAVQTVRQIVPVGLRAAAKINPAHAEMLEACALACEVAVDLPAARVATSAARAKALEIRAAYADDAVSYVAYAAAHAAHAADAVAYAAAHAAHAADAVAYAAADAVAYAAADDVLSKAAEIACQALIKLGSKGAQWLFLTDEAAAKESAS